MYFNQIFVGKKKRKNKDLEFIYLYRPVQLRYNRTVSMFGFDQVHEYVLKLVDVNTCPEMDENCPEADKLDISKCLSGMSNKQKADLITSRAFSQIQTGENQISH
jgi:hypothetical protein